MTSIHHLARDTWASEIMQRLVPRDIAALQQCSKQLYEIGEDERVWRRWVGYAAALASDQFERDVHHVSGLSSVWSPSTVRSGTQVALNAPERQQQARWQKPAPSL